MFGEGLFEKEKIGESDSRVRLFLGDSRLVLSHVQSHSIGTVVTSPPYWGLRAYGDESAIGLEASIDEYLSNLVDVFSQVLRCLREDGTMWVVIGDVYTSGGRKYRHADAKAPFRGVSRRPGTPKGLKEKDLVGLPWRVASSLQSSGWYVRSEVIWSKPNSMPESVSDRPHRSHEVIFLLSKSKNYYFNKDAQHSYLKSKGFSISKSVWSIPVNRASVGHPASFPINLVHACLAGTGRMDHPVLDPFLGSGTVAVAALERNLSVIGIDLEQGYLEMTNRRLARGIGCSVIKV